MELTVKRETRHIEDGEQCEQHGIDAEDDAVLPARVHEPQQEARHKAHECKAAGRLHAQAEAAPECQFNIRRRGSRAHIRTQHKQEKEPENGKDCQVKSIYLQSFQDSPI